MYVECVCSAFGIACMIVLELSSAVEQDASARQALVSNPRSLICVVLHIVMYLKAGSCWSLVWCCTITILCHNGIAGSLWFLTAWGLHGGSWFNLLVSSWDLGPLWQRFNDDDDNGIALLNLTLGSVSFRWYFHGLLLIWVTSPGSICHHNQVSDCH